MDDETTPLDRAHALMQAAPEDEAARMRFYERLADGELFLLLAEEATDDEIAPQVFPVDGGTYVLVFDREARLAAFSGRIAPYAALSGRNIAGLLTGQGVGLAVNLGAPSAILIPEAAVGWLAETLGPAPEEVTEVPEEVSRPTGLALAHAGAGRYGARGGTRAGAGRGRGIAVFRPRGGRAGRGLLSRRRPGLRAAGPRRVAV